MPTNIIIVSPLAKIPDVLSVLGIDMSANPPLFTLADAPIRPATHRIWSSAVTPAQRAIIDAHMISPHPDLEGVVCAVYIIPGPSPKAALLAANGLTNNNGSMG